jgi:hypothetical protein
MSLWGFIFEVGRMSSDEKKHDALNSNFSFGVRELRESTAVRKKPSGTEPLVAVDENRGVDPYNTSGSFDRTRAWARVGKR